MNNVLLLDKNYMPLTIIGYKKALMLLVKNKAENIAVPTTYTIRATNFIGYISSIVRLTVSIPWQAQQSKYKFNRKHVLIRDQFRCRYCDKKLGKQTTTIDHIIPVSRGGKSSYDNCVACCVSCNNVKGDRTPAEIGFVLLSKPIKPNFFTICKYNSDLVPEEWNNYIRW